METREIEHTPAPVRLRLWDTTSIIVGIIIGVGIFQTPAAVFANSSGPWIALGIWALGGLISLLGAFCFAELATTYPRSGGEYVYLTRAYGPMAGFLFAWAQLAVIRTGGSIAALAYIFAHYAGKLCGLDESFTVLYALIAAAVILMLTAVNVLGVRFGARTQNALTVVKIVSLVLLLAAGFLFAAPTSPVVVEGRLVAAKGDMVIVQTAAGEAARQVAPRAKISVDGSENDPAGQPWQLAALEPGLSVKLIDGEGGVTAVRATRRTPLVLLALALIFVLWTYAGWHEAGYVAAEVEHPRRNLPRALFLGTGAVTLLYLLLNAAYLAGLGFEASAASQAPAADVLGLVWGESGQRLMALLVVVSALGAINGMIFTSARIFAALGEDHRMFAALAGTSPRFGTPVRSLLVQAGVCVATVAVIGLALRSKDGFDTLLYVSSPVFYIFFFLTGLSVLVLRWKDPDRERPFVTPFYPVVPLLFCAVFLVMLYHSVQAKPLEACVGLSVLALGVPLYFLSRDWDKLRKKDFTGAIPALSPAESHRLTKC